MSALCRLSSKADPAMQGFRALLSGAELERERVTVLDSPDEAKTSVNNSNGETV